MRGRSGWCVVAVVAALLWFGNRTNAQPELDAVTETALAQRVDAFLRALATGEVGTGLDDLVKAGPLSLDVDRYEKLRSGLPQILGRYGRFQRSERLKVERIGQSMVRFTMLYHCTNYPVVWRITFYRGDLTATTWNVIALEFDTEYSRLSGDSRSIPN